MFAPTMYSGFRSPLAANRSGSKGTTSAVTNTIKQMPNFTPTVRRSPAPNKQNQINKLTEDFNKLKVYNADPNSNLRESLLQANEQMGTADKNVWARNRGNLFAGLDTGFKNSENDMMASLAKRGIADSGVAVKGFADLANSKAGQMAQVDNQAYQGAVQTGDAYRQQKMANLTGYTQLGRGMSGTTQNYLAQAGSGYNAAGSQAGNTAIGLGNLNNSFNANKWNAQANADAGKGQSTGALVGAGATMLSDMRLKKNVKQIGTVNGHRLVVWDWNEKGLKLAAGMPTIGVIAQEAQKIDPEAVREHESGYLMVDYSKIFKGVYNGIVG